ncbi:Gp138-N domain-containing protein [Acetobacteraceae bacterium EV16G]|uniref:Gp138-N domain-containing protein n=2 Tax=Sorlinia euscelidii TaxID=3081148 RepID=A0ABU7U4I0_9PROT
MMARIPFPTSTLPQDFASNRGAIEYLIRQHLSLIGPPMFAEVVAFYPGQNGGPGRVDVHPMVHQQDAAGRVYPHGVILDIPYMRLQAGTSAIILDPQPGDIGFLLVSGRDHSGVVATGKESPPGSFRQFDMSDSVFIGGFLNPAPTQFIQFTESGIRIVASGPVEIEADNVHITGALKVDGDVTSGNISLTNHVHGGVQTGGSTTGKAQ